MNLSISSPPHEVVTELDWIAARRRLLVEEKKLTRQQERVAAARRELPWVHVTKKYAFDSARGKIALADLFGGRSQLIIKHNMLNPKHDVCVGCSLEMDHLQAALVHLEHHDVSVVAVSRAPLEQIQQAQQRMGWTIPWVSSHGGDFNYDFHVAFRPEDIARRKVFYNYEEKPIPIEDLSGFSVFYKDEDDNVFHTYSSFGRGAENVMSVYVLLDMTPKGRNEGPRGNLSDWARPHDRYDVPGHTDEIGQFIAAENCCRIA